MPAYESFGVSAVDCGAIKKYKAYTLPNLRTIPQIARLPERQIFEMEVVAQVFPFKANNYVIEELICWDDVPNDPIFVLTFPQKNMLKPHHFERMADLMLSGAGRTEIKAAANEIRMQLNPHPAGQVEKNMPALDGFKLEGVQHKYRETALFFPSHGQTCHAYCSFCFRWPQFVGMDGVKFAMRDTERLVAYLAEHPEVTDVLFTGGDPLIMRTRHLKAYLETLLAADLPHLQTIRIGSKALSYWPYRFVTYEDADELIALFEQVVQSGKHLSLMAHFNHPNELKTNVVRQAIARIRGAGVEIRTQSPILAHINDNTEAWRKMWKEQVALGCIPYYMFVVRDTGAQHYFGITLERAWEIFGAAFRGLSGLARTVRGPSMSATPGKVHVLGITEVKGEKVFVLQFLQSRNPDWSIRPFFAKYDPEAIWLDDLKPAFGEPFFFFEEEELCVPAVV